MAVAITAKQTQAGHSSQIALAHHARTTYASVIPTISASAACRLGIAAYWFDASSMTPLPWLKDANCWSVSTNPSVGNMRGGAVG